MKFTYNKKETKKETIDISNMSDEEIEELINQKKAEVEILSKKIDADIKSIRSMIDDNYLSDERLKYLIADYDSPLFTFSAALFFILGIALVIFLSAITDSIKLTKGLAVIYTVILLGMFFGLYYVRYTRQKKFAEEHYRESQLFKSEFVKVTTRLSFSKYDKSLYNYFVVFLDENNKKRKHKISKELCNKYKLNPPHMLYVLKLPQYKNGYFYHSIDTSSFENESFLKEQSKNYIR